MERQSHKRAHQTGLKMRPCETLIEERLITGQKVIHQPTRKEWGNHTRTHVPFRKCCPFSTKGKRKVGAHQRVKKSDEDIEDEVSAISMDHMAQNQKIRNQKTLSFCPSWRVWIGNPNECLHEICSRGAITRMKAKSKVEKSS